MEKLKDGDIANFETLKRACKAGDLALVSSELISTGEYRALVCAMQDNGDGTVTPVPFAEMVTGNPFEIYADPTV